MQALWARESSSASLKPKTCVFITKSAEFLIKEMLNVLSATFVCFKFIALWLEGIRINENDMLIYVYISIKQVHIYIMDENSNLSWVDDI